MLLREFVIEKMAEGRLSRSKFGLKCGISYGTVTNIIEGRQVSQEMILRIASAYGRHPGSFIEWEGGNYPVPDLIPSNLVPTPSSSRYIPVVSGINGGSTSMLCWEDAYPKGQGMDMVGCPDYLERDDKAYALRVHGESMAPKYTEGMIVYVSPSAEITNGDFVVAKLRNGKTLLKKVQFSDNLVILQSINLIAEPEPVITSLQDLEFLSKVVGSKER